MKSKEQITIPATLPHHFRRLYLSIRRAIFIFKRSRAFSLSDNSNPAILHLTYSRLLIFL